MEYVDAAEEQAPAAEQQPVINDFSIVVATVNGTGSQTANLALLRAFFKMGIPVNGKNIFPSNIQGLPTWYQIRVSHEGYVARRETNEILVAFNQDTVVEDIAALPAGGVCLYNDDWRSIPQRKDITYYSVPVNRFVAKTGMKGKLRDYITNMIYVGALAHLLNIPLSQIDDALDYHFKSRRKLVETNMDMVRTAHEWAVENLTKVDPYEVTPMNETAGMIMMTGNEAAGLGAVYGGVSFVAWYPITPSTSVIDAINDYLPMLRKDKETGEKSYAVIQAEDELAAIGMLLGAGWSGARAMTATSGPGLSLMAEFAGLGYFAEIPAVIWDIQRVGPSTGLPTRTGQCDIIFTYYLGHGDTKNVILLPSSIKECFEFGTTAFNLAAELQTPVFVLSDLDLGMNNWMSEPFDYPNEPINRGKVLTAEEVEEKGFARYEDLDGDGIGYRTLPGTNHRRAAYFTRGTGHNAKAVYSEKPDDWLNNMARINRKFETARRLVPAAVVKSEKDAKLGIIGYGTSCYAIEEARDRLEKKGIKTSFMRLRALPINAEVKEFIAAYDKVYVVELNRDGQMHMILQTEVPEMAAKLVSLAHLDGMPLTARWIVEAIEAEEQL
ncbi:MAG: 2-oxoacid:acceptor oxidoreductase subunit alpha [Anaerolineales bacterium]|nr:2-oxoacid:acceptor oxidoreductase subunit alpha [Anaerolineales bacterium]